MDNYNVRPKPISTKPELTEPTLESLGRKAFLPYRILIAEDCPDNRDAMALKLEARGARVKLVQNGRRCVETVLSAQKRGRPYDVVVVDVLMPVLDGFSTALLLRDNQFNGLIVSTTERGLYCDEMESVQSGCDYHVVKSDLYRQLIPLIRRSLDDYDYEGPNN